MPGPSILEKDFSMMRDILRPGYRENEVESLKDYINKKAMAWLYAKIWAVRRPFPGRS